MPSVLQKEISKIWWIPLGFVGLPFLLAAAGRIFAALGAGSFGETLVEWARIYGNLPASLLGFSPSAMGNTPLAYVLAGLVYSGLVFLCAAVIRPSLWRTRG